MILYIKMGDFLGSGDGMNKGYNNAVIRQLKNPEESCWNTISTWVYSSSGIPCDPPLPSMRRVIKSLPPITQ